MSESGGPLQVMYWIAVSIGTIAIAIGTFWAIYRRKQPSKPIVIAGGKKDKVNKIMHKERMPKRYLICGILGTILLLWVIYKTPRLDLQTIVDYQTWKAPDCLKQELRTIDEAQHKLDPIIDANSMYCILVRNEGRSVATHVALTVPDTNYVEVMREGKNPEEIPPSELIPLGDIQIEEQICVNAWATCPVSRHNARGVAIFNELGTAPLYVRTPVGAIARWINKYITARVLLILIVVALVCVFVYWPIKRFVLIVKQISHGP